MSDGWLARTRELHGELSALAEDDVRWWLLAAGAAITERWPARPGYVVSNAEPGADTFIGYRAPAPVRHDPLHEAIERARAARTAIRALDGALPDQPLAMTIDQPRDGGTVLTPSALDVAAFAIGGHCVIARLDDPTLPDQLASAVHGLAPPAWRGSTPFVCVSIGDDPIGVARHGHRRAWRDGRGPWLGLGRTGELATVSTCHFVVDGFGHASLASRIHALVDGGASARAGSELRLLTLPPLAPVAGASPLGVAWRSLDGERLRALPLAYAAGQILHRMAGEPDARFSPTLQIPVVPGALEDPERRRRRAMPAAVSVRFTSGVVEPFAMFEARAREVLERETLGHGLCARLFAAARAAPTPLAWKRRGFSTARPRWLDRVSDVVGGRACVSRIRIDAPLPPACAVSSPSRQASMNDPMGACVMTVVDDGERAALTVCGSGLAGTDDAARAVLDEILASALPPAQRSHARR
jgi:hypothetical protein